MRPNKGLMLSAERATHTASSLFHKLQTLGSQFHKNVLIFLAFIVEELTDTFTPQYSTQAKTAWRGLRLPLKIFLIATFQAVDILVDILVHRDRF